MNNLSLFAQSTGIPNNGASNAQDFQPPTQNPQNPGTLQQQSSGVQDPTGQDILNNPNAHISVPVNPDTPKPAPQVTAAGVDWLLVVLVSLVLVAIAEVFFMRRDKKRATRPVAASLTKTFLAENRPDETTQERVEQVMEPEEPKYETAPKPKKKKSKSKRKKR